MCDIDLKREADLAQAASADGHALARATTPGELSVFLGQDPNPASRAAVVLVAEDNRSNRAFIEAVLRAFGIETVCVSNGQQALEEAQSREFDAVLMDCYMPTLDGVEASRQLRELERRAGRRRVPIVALTAAAMPDDRERCIEAGMDEFLLKPFDIDRLRQVLTQVLPSFALKPV